MPHFFLVCWYCLYLRKSKQMKFHHWIIILSPTFLMAPRSCGPEYVDNSRIFVEGKILGSNVSNVQIQLANEDILVSETTAKADGNFSLGGAATTQQTSLKLNRKILNYNSTISNTSLSYDSMQILLPENVNYVKFNQITVE